MNKLTTEIATLVVKALEKALLIQVEVSARHVHLSQDDMTTLFGAGETLTPKKPLSQPGQFLSEQRISIAGSKSEKDNVAILGPLRQQTQIELSQSDCIQLGIKAPVRDSGDVSQSGAVSLKGPKGCIKLEQGAIIASSHIHILPQTAQIMGLVDGELVNVEILTNRPIILKNVLIRVSEMARDRMHIDFDEANACQVSGFTLGKIIKIEQSKQPTKGEVPMNLSQDLLLQIITQVVEETLQKQKPDFERVVDPSGIIAIKGKTVTCERFEKDGVALKDVVTIEEAPRMGAGIMEVDNTFLEWTLTYDEFDYVIDGTLEIVIDDRVVVANQGDIVYIPKGSHIQFRSTNGKARYFYTVYPANWMDLKE